MTQDQVKELNNKLAQLKRRENDIAASAAAATEALSKLHREASLQLHMSLDQVPDIALLAGEAIAQLTSLSGEVDAAKLEAWTLASEE